MTYKISMNITPGQIEELINQLPAKDKIALSKKLMEANAKKAVRGILKRADSRKGHRPSINEIIQEIHDYRKAKNARRH